MSSIALLNATQTTHNAVHCFGQAAVGSRQSGEWGLYRVQGRGRPSDRYQCDAHHFYPLRVAPPKHNSSKQAGMNNILWDSIRILPRSSYATSMQGMTWEQVVSSPLPPYISFLPVLFRVLGWFSSPVLVGVVAVCSCLPVNLHSLPCYCTRHRSPHPRPWRLPCVENI